MRVLIGCEKSGIIREEFAKRGHDAWSCDLEATEIKGQHIQGDILNVMNWGWDLAIFHPECRFLCFSGERWIKEIPGRMEERLKAFEFFKAVAGAPIEKICVENSHSIFLNREYKKPTQAVHPYHFGDPFKKMTCLWLKNLPALIPTNILPEDQRKPACWLEGPGPNRSTNRARTYPGIARAMAQQWG